MDTQKSLVTIPTMSTVPVCTIELVQEDGSLLAVDLPALAELDAAFLRTWLHGKSEKTQHAYVADMSKFYAVTGKSLQDVRLEDLQAFIDSLVSLKPSSKARAIATIKSALTFAQRTGYLQVNVGTVVKLPKLEDKLAERIMSEQAVARMLALESNTRNHAILTLLYRAGLRVSELCSLEWCNLTERDQAGQIAVFGKGKKTRYVLLDAGTWEELQLLRPATAQSNDYVFQSRQAHSRAGKSSKRIDESQVHRIVSAAAKRAGITGNVSPHWMRHAHATHSLEHGAPITLVKETLGHTSLETTSRYVHARPNASSAQYLVI